jgi:hypothetical protein
MMSKFGTTQFPIDHKPEPLGLWWLWLILLALALLLLLSPAHAQDHTHDGDVGQFYQSWQKPDPGLGADRRNGSCCNKKDCRPVVAMRAASGGRASWEVQLLEPDGSLSSWYRVPDGLWEDQQPDPRESPDGQSHACERNGRVICAVRGGDG